MNSFRLPNIPSLFLLMAQGIMTMGCGNNQHGQLGLGNCYFTEGFQEIKKIRI